MRLSDENHTDIKGTWTSNSCLVYVAPFCSRISDSTLFALSVPPKSANTPIMVKSYKPLALFIALLFLFLEARVDAHVSVPFNSSLVGRTFHFFVSGLRFPIMSRIEVSQTRISYFPRYNSKTALTGTPNINCARSLQLVMNRLFNQTFFVYYPNRSPGCCSECDLEPEFVYPSGPTREQFVNDTRFMFRAIRVLRNSDGSERHLNCRTPPTVCKPTPRPELNELLSYLYGIGYTVNVCVEE